MTYYCISPLCALTLLLINWVNVCHVVYCIYKFICITSSICISTCLFLPLPVFPLSGSHGIIFLLYQYLYPYALFLAQPWHLWVQFQKLSKVLWDLYATAPPLH